MKQTKKIVGGLLVMALSGVMLPCTAQVPEKEKHVIQFSETDSVKRYVTVMSWEHKRELYIAHGR